MRVAREKEYISRSDATSYHEVARSTKVRSKHGNLLIYIMRVSANASVAHQKMADRVKKRGNVSKGIGHCSCNL
jgi:hypothetical protein